LKVSTGEALADRKKAGLAAWTIHAEEQVALGISGERP